MKDCFDLIVLGGGASGIIASIVAAEKGQKVLLVEKNDRPGRKIASSGNGRCNIMNRQKHRYYGDSSFASQVLKQCDLHDLTGFFRKYGLLLTEEREGRMYPVTFHSSSVIDALLRALKINGVFLRTNCRASTVSKERNLFCVSVSENEAFRGNKLLVSCGGPACPSLGATADGYGFLRTFGHHTVPQYPSLVPVVTEPVCISGMKGIRVQCVLSLLEDQRLLHRTEGELLFTEYGISGICAMQCSRFLHQHPRAYFEADFLSRIFSDPSEAKAELLRRRKTFSGFSPCVLLEGLLLPRLAFAVCKQAGLTLRGETAAELDDDALDRIVYSATHYHIQPTGTRGMEYAQVTSGGAVCSEFNAHTMESLICPGLYAAGEVLNVDGDCGGYNLMFAFASGMLAGGFRKTAFSSVDQEDLP